MTAYQDRSSVEDEWDDTHGVNADGTNRRVINGECWEANPAGTWSPDGSRIVCLDGDYNGINVYNITTGHASHVAKRSTAIRLDRHTLARRDLTTDGNRRWGGCRGNDLE